MFSSDDDDDEVERRTRRLTRKCCSYKKPSSTRRRRVSPWRTSHSGACRGYALHQRVFGRPTSPPGLKTPRIIPSSVNTTLTFAQRFLPAWDLRVSVLLATPSSSHRRVAMPNGVPLNVLVLIRKPRARACLSEQALPPQPPARRSPRRHRRRDRHIHRRAVIIQHNTSLSTATRTHCVDAQIATFKNVRVGDVGRPPPPGVPLGALVPVVLRSPAARTPPASKNPSPASPRRRHHRPRHPRARRRLAVFRQRAPERVRRRPHAHDLARGRRAGVRPRAHRLRASSRTPRAVQLSYARASIRVDLGGTSSSSAMDAHRTARRSRRTRRGRHVSGGSSFVDPSARVIANAEPDGRAARRSTRGDAARERARRTRRRRAQTGSGGTTGEMR